MLLQRIRPDAMASQAVVELLKRSLTLDGSEEDGPLAATGGVWERGLQCLCYAEVDRNACRDADGAHPNISHGLRVYMQGWSQGTMSTE